MATTLFDSDQAQSKMVPLDHIREDEDTQARALFDEGAIEDYANAMAAGKQLPDVELYFDGEWYWIGDGWHRIRAAKRLQRTAINATVHAGSKRDALLCAVGANTTHGVRRQNEDKRRAVLMLLQDDEWSKWSDHEIARQCKVSQPFVSKLRRELSDNGYQIATETRLVERGGTVFEQRVSSEARAEAAQARAEAELNAKFDQGAITLLGRTDAGAWHRAIDVARRLVAADVWDGAEHIEFDAYALHDRLFGTEALDPQALVYGRDIFRVDHAAKLKPRILDLLARGPLTLSQLRERLEIDPGDKSNMDALRRALEYLVGERRVKQLRDLYLPMHPAQDEKADEADAQLILRALADGPQDIRALDAATRLGPFRLRPLLGRMLDHGQIVAGEDNRYTLPQLEQHGLVDLVPQLVVEPEPQPTADEVDAANGFTEASAIPYGKPDERAEVPEGSAEWQQGMAEDDARRQQTEADAEAEPDDELADDCTGDYDDIEPDAEPEDDADDWERNLPPTQTALDAERLLALLPADDAVSLTRLRDRSDLPADRTYRAVNLLEADGKLTRTRTPNGVMITRLAPPDPLAAIPADQRVEMLRLLHELRANTHELLRAAWDGADYEIRDGDAPGNLALAQGWITPVSKWSSGAQWCTGYVLSTAGRAIYEALLAAHPEAIDNTQPASVARLVARTHERLDALHAAARAVIEDCTTLAGVGRTLADSEYGSLYAHLDGTEGVTQTAVERLKILQHELSGGGKQREA